MAIYNRSREAIAQFNEQGPIDAHKRTHHVREIYAVPRGRSAES